MSLDSAQQSRRPSLSSLEIPTRTLETSMSDFSAPSPASSRAGLPPRPSSAKVRSTVKNLFPQRSLRAKNLSHDGEKTVLIVPETPLSSDAPQATRPTTSRSFSLNKVFFSPSTKLTSSLPVTPVGNSDIESALSGSDGHPEFSVSETLLVIGWFVFFFVLLFFIRFFWCKFLSGSRSRPSSYDPFVFGSCEC